MQAHWWEIIEMFRHDPAVVLGFFLIGSGAVLFVHIQFKMRAVGYDTFPLISTPKDWGLPFEYLKIRGKHGWSPWPAYLVWPCYVAGTALLLFGLSHLQD